MSFTLPQLKYTVNALERSIDAITMEIHHDKHHATYITNLNAAIEKHPALSEASIEKLLVDLENVPEDIRITVRNSGGGHWNHTFFWDLLSPEKQEISEKLQSKLITAFGSIESFKDQFKSASLGRFGSGWAWLVKMPDGTLKITSTPNQDNPLMPIAEIQGKPILGLDVWEHAYYLKYQNKRGEYIDAFWDIVNWNLVEELIG